MFEKRLVPIIALMRYEKSKQRLQCIRGFQLSHTSTRTGMFCLDQLATNIYQEAQPKNMRSKNSAIIYSTSMGKAVSRNLRLKKLR